jgi:hypothetical protein
MFCPQYIYVFRVDPRTKSNFFSIQHSLIGFYNRGRECFLRGTNWVFILDRYYSFVLKGVNCQDIDISGFRCCVDEAFTLLVYCKGKPCADTLP